MAVEFSYQVQNADGSTQTMGGRADRAPTWGELQDHVASTGAQLLPSTPAEQPPAQIASTAPPPEAEQAPAPSVGPSEVPAPSLGERAWNVVTPNRTFWSQLPSVGGAIGGAEVGAEVGTLGGPFAPVTIPAGAIIGAAVGSGGMEAAQTALERRLGWQPAEAAPAGERVANAALRGGAFELLPLGVKTVVGAPVLRAVIPTARAAEQVAPVLAQAPEAAPEAMQPLAQWWAQNAPLGADHVVKAWSNLAESGKLPEIAGDYLPQMQQIINATKAKGINWAHAATQGMITGGGGFMHGLPTSGTAALAAVPTVAQAAVKAVPSMLRAGVLSPTGSQFLAALPRVGSYVAPALNTATRIGAQVAAPFLWPKPQDIFEGPPQPPS